MNMRVGFLYAMTSLWAAHAHAHHSFPVHYIPERTATISGVVSEFRYRNPHAVVFVAVRGENGAEEVWTVEWSGSSALRRRGILPDVIVTGDRVTIVGNPARDGSTAMRLNTVSFEDDRAPIGPPVRGTNDNED
jgi:hypothetical protein